jgi:hypothetical protein
LSGKLRDVWRPTQETLNGVGCAVYPTRYVDGYKGMLWVGLADGLPHQLDAQEPLAKWHIVFEYGKSITIKKPAL